MDKFEIQIMQYRKDKTARLKTRDPRYGNRLENVQLLLQIIKDPPTMQDILRASKCMTWYNQETYYVPRCFKRKCYSRKTHGQIKYDLIQKYGTNKSIVDIGFGDGSDYLKYKKANSKVLGIETCPRNLMIAKSKLFDRRDRVCESFPTIGHFDTAFLFFSIHYFDMDLLCENLRRSNTIVITCMDGLTLKKVCDENGEYNFDFGKGKIIDEDQNGFLVPFSFPKKEKIDITLDSMTKAKRENLIIIDDMIREIMGKSYKKYCEIIPFPDEGSSFFYKTLVFYN
mgnify:CR=1 FL=1